MAVRKNVHDTREGWLKAAMPRLTTMIEEHGHKVPARIMVSCGWPKSKSKAIGECWDSQCSDDKEVPHIFISPVMTDEVQVVGVLLHEMIHAAVGLKCHHRGPFKKVARGVGLEGKLTATHVEENTPLHAQIVLLLEELGPYPHLGLTPLKKRAKRDDSYINLYSPQVGSEFKVRMKLDMANEHGRPRDPWGNQMVTEDELGAGGEDEEGEDQEAA